MVLDLFVVKTWRGCCARHKTGEQCGVDSSCCCFYPHLILPLGRRRSTSSGDSLADWPWGLHLGLSHARGDDTHR